MASKRSLSSFCLFLMAAALATGCVAQRREAYMRERAGEYVYRKPLAEVWPQVKAVLEAQGYSLRTTPGSFELLTDWQQMGGPSSLGSVYVRYLVRGIERSPGLCTVDFLRQNRTEAGPGAVNSATGQREESTVQDTTSMTKDLELSWELLKKMEPDTAESLRAEAEQKVK